jgi:hypothetical protein
MRVKTQATPVNIGIAAHKDVAAPPFDTFAAQIHKNYNELAKHELFVTQTTDGEGEDAVTLWDLYLAAFPEGTNPIFRTKPENDCNCCKNFVKNIGNLVCIVDGVVHTVWENCEEVPEPFRTVAAAMHDLVSKATIVSVFRTEEPSFGKERTLDAHNKDLIWKHFSAQIKRTHQGNPTQRGALNSKAQVLQRGIKEISVENLRELIDLIEQNGVYRGAEFLTNLQKYLALKLKYVNYPKPELFGWEYLQQDVAALRNSVIGTLLQDLADGKELAQAVQSFERKVAPTNYKRPTALVTPKMIDRALETIRSLDMESALERRFAKLHDLNVNDVLWVDNTASPQMQDGLKAMLMSSVKTPVTTTKNATSLTMDELLALKPKELSVVLENQHLSNFVSLTAPVHPELNSLFSWENSFGWSYEGEVTDSIKARVAKAGGNVDAKLRCSLSWFNTDDLDIHCLGPDGHIYYGNRKNILDVDMNINAHSAVKDPVENLSWNNPKDGIYEIIVRQFSRRNTTDVGCQLEIEFDGTTYNFSYSRGVIGEVSLAIITITNGAILSLLTGTGVVGATATVVNKWGVKTNTPQPVDTILLSPNHWENSSKTGNKHWFFILKDCKNPDPVRGIYNEFLHPRFHEHRKVFELLGSKTKCPYSEEQLSGVGFSSTQRASMNVLVDGRPYKVEFS